MQVIDESKLLQNFDGIACQNHTGSYFAELYGTFKHERFDPVPLASKSCGKASNAPSNNEDSYR